MLDIVPSRRPTAAHILRHPWILQNSQLVVQTVDTPSTTFGQVGVRDSTAAALKGAVTATFRAIASPHTANVGPVGMSALAKRRARDKIGNAHIT